MPASSLVVRTQDAAAVDAVGNNIDYPPAKGSAGKKKKASFECSHCSRKFATRSHLVRHSRVHTGERRYACDYPGCEMRCSRKDNLQQHYRTHLVVNPRRANAAQSMPNNPQSTSPDHLDGAHDTSNNTATSTTGHPPDMLISPTELKPLDTQALGGPPPLGSSLTSAIEQTTATHTLDVHGNPVEREWSPSPPPPPLSSAYDYWYAHGCLPHTVRNPASVSGSGSSGATSPEMSNALELAHHYHQQQHHQHAAPPQPQAHHQHPHMAPRNSYVESPTNYYHPVHPAGPTAANGGYYESEPPSSAGGLRSSYPLATATFPTAAEYHHPPPTVHHHHGHQRSHSHTGYPMNTSANPTTAGSYGRVGGYESATTSPHIANAHLHQAHPHQQPHTNGRHPSYSAESYNHHAAAAAVYHSAASSPTVEHRSYHAHYAPHHAHSNSGGGEASRPVTRHGSMSTPTAPTSGPMPVYPHASGMMAYVPVDVIQQHAPPVSYGESTRHSQSVTNSPRMSSGGHFPGHHPQQQQQHHHHQHHPQQPTGQSSLILPPIRYSDDATIGLSSGGAGAVNPNNGAPGSASSTAYALGAGHFGSAGPNGGWERVSDARALPPHQSKPQ